MAAAIFVFLALMSSKALFMAISHSSGTSFVDSAVGVSGLGLIVFARVLVPAAREAALRF